jgi:hypothetical protein
MGRSVKAIEGDVPVGVGFIDLETGRVMKAGEESPAGESIPPGGCVAAGDEDAGAGFVSLIPFDGDAVSGILGFDPTPRGEKARTNSLEPDEADSDERDAMNEPRAERSGKYALDNFGAGPEIDEDAAVDRPVDDGKLHGRSPSLWRTAHARNSLTDGNRSGTYDGDTSERSMGAWLAVAAAAGTVAVDRWHGRD